jgi:hypothetical protein
MGALSIYLSERYSQIGNNTYNPCELDKNIKNLLWIPLGSELEISKGLKTLFDQTYTHEQKILKSVCEEIPITKGQTYAFSR